MDTSAEKCYKIGHTGLCIRGIDLWGSAVGVAAVGVTLRVCDQ